MCAAQTETRSVRDTLKCNGMMFLLEKTPMDFFPEYRELFDFRTEVIILASDRNINKGYIVTFEIQNDKLYVINVNQNKTRGELWGNDLNSSQPIEVFPKIVADSTVRNRMEKITGRHYNKNNWLSADWVTGSFVAQIVQTEKNYHTTATDYVFDFKNGMLIKP